MRITVLVGGVGGARFLQGLERALGLGEPDCPHEVTAVVNVGDDVWMHGLRICPDLDTCMYTLGGGIDVDRGWGQAQESWVVKAALADYHAPPDWFGLGDKDIATHLVRTRMLRAGIPLSEVTDFLCRRWQPAVRLLPVTDDDCETHVKITDPADGALRAVHFQEWWVRHRAQVPTHAFVQIGARQATPGPGVLEAITDADAVLLAPSNPVVSIGAVLAVPGIRGALRSARGKVVGVSPIVAGSPLRGMADVCLATIGVPTTAEAVGRHYGARSANGLLDAWMVHTGEEVDVPGVAVAAVPLLMTDTDATATMARTALTLAGLNP